MAARGTIAIVVNDKKFKTYNHSDSYLESLGNVLLKDIRFLLENYTKEELIDKFSNLRVVSNESDKPTKEDMSNMQILMYQLDFWMIGMYY